MQYTNCSLSHVDNVVDYVTTAYKTIYHMEEDLYIPGNIIFSDHNSLKTTDGKYLLQLVLHCLNAVCIWYWGVGSHKW